MEKKYKTIWAIVAGLVIVGLLSVVVFWLFKYVITAVVAFGFGYFFGYKNRKVLKS